MTYSTTDNGTPPPSPTAKIVQKQHKQKSVQTGRSLFVADLMTKSIITIGDNGSFRVWADKINPRRSGSRIGSSNLQNIASRSSDSHTTKSSRRTRFTGPCCLLPDDDGRIFFTDAGDLRNCKAGSLNGSVYVCEMLPAEQVTKPHRARANSNSSSDSINSNSSSSNNERFRKPLVTAVVDGGLAFPTGLAWAGRDDLLVCESFLNRILRVKRDSTSGRWHTSIFATFDSRFGPTAIVARRNRKSTGQRKKMGGDKISLFVAHSALRNSGEQARILRLRPSGEVARIYELPGCEYINSMSFRSGNTLIFTESDKILQLNLHK